MKVTLTPLAALLLLPRPALPAADLTDYAPAPADTRQGVGAVRQSGR